MTYSRTSVSGNFLAARHAGAERDAAAAAAYYRAALRGDPRNNEILGRAFLAVLANGEVEEAMRLAERVVQADKTDRIAHLVLGVRAIKQKQYAAARKEITQSVRGPITDLTAALLTAWTQATAGRKQGGARWRRQARRPRVVHPVQVAPRRPDPRRDRPEEGCRQAL